MPVFSEDLSSHYHGAYKKKGVQLFSDIPNTVKELDVLSCCETLYIYIIFILAIDKTGKLKSTIQLHSIPKGQNFSSLL